jgi:hypothetical protein
MTNKRIARSCRRDGTTLARHTRHPTVARARHRRRQSLGADCPTTRQGRTQRPVDTRVCSHCVHSAHLMTLVSANTFAVFHIPYARRTVFARRKQQIAVTIHPHTRQRPVVALQYQRFYDHDFERKCLLSTQRCFDLLLINEQILRKVCIIDFNLTTYFKKSSKLSTRDSLWSTTTQKFVKADASG